MKQIEFINNILGDNFLEELSKAEVVKPITQTVVDHEELASALKIVPRVVMSWLVKTLSPLKEGDTLNVEIPFPQTANSKLELKKLTNDVYSGNVIQDNKIVNRFLYRTIPGIGLILLTTFEMYQIEDLDKDQPKPISDYVQSVVEEKLKLKEFVEKVVDKKMSERDAIENLVLAKINSKIAEKIATPELNVQQNKDKEKIKSTKPLKGFLDNRKNKKKHAIPLKKSEVLCPDCGSIILQFDKITPCICYGENRESKISLTKSENNYLLTFSKGWDKENIEMILDVLRKGAKNG